MNTRGNHTIFQAHKAWGQHTSNIRNCVWGAKPPILALRYIQGSLDRLGIVGRVRLDDVLEGI